MGNIKKMLRLVLPPILIRIVLITYVYLTICSSFMFFLQNNKNNHNSNHVKSYKKDGKADNANDKKEKRPKTDRDKIDKLNDKTPHTSGIKRKLEEGECDPEPTENKRHER